MGMGNMGIIVSRDIAGSFSEETMRSGASVTGVGYVVRRTGLEKDVAQSAMFIPRFYH